MLETTDIDDDYFTPVPSTSLANIFDGPSTKKNANESLKYTPPKKQVPLDKSVVQNVETKADEDSKITECMFACALTAYEWVNNKYSSRGKLGFAILKISKTSSYSIVLYNANKATISNTPVTTELNVTLKGNNYISYYDNQNKYWSVYGKKEDISKIIQILKSLEVDIKYISNADQCLPEPINTENEYKKSTISCDKESDTDSSVNRRTKASILNRMANMGHSVLPSNTLIDKSSDSSDLNESSNQPPKTRPKPNKIPVKRTSIDKIGPDSDTTDFSKMSLANVELNSKHILNPSLFAIVNGQLVPVSNTNMMPNCGGSSNSEINLFMTEQRMNNNELRLNINRTTDKVDQVLEKLYLLERPLVDKSNFQIEIMQKLLGEYEVKIKKYEQILATKKEDCIEKRISPESYESKIAYLQSVIEKNIKENINLTMNVKEHELVEEISRLKNELALETDKVEELTRELDESRKASIEGEALESKLKEVMNNVYHSIATNFEHEKSYSGDNINKVVASILKKATIQSLNEYN